MFDEEMSEQNELSPLSRQDVDIVINNKKNTLFYEVKFCLQVHNETRQYYNRLCPHQKSITYDYKTHNAI